MSVGDSVSNDPGRRLLLLCVSVKVSEDCLYLNVFVPLDVDFRSPLQRPLPVLLWVHGGDFIAGSASKPLYDGRFVSNLTHTVVVSVEYRLGEDARNRFTPKSGLEVFTRGGSLDLTVWVWTHSPQSTAHGPDQDPDCGPHSLGQ